MAYLKLPLPFSHPSHLNGYQTVIKIKGLLCISFFGSHVSSMIFCRKCKVALSAITLTLISEISEISEISAIFNPYNTSYFFFFYLYTVNREMA